MRRVTLLLWTSVVATSAADQALAQRSGVFVASARAGQSPQILFFGDRAAQAKVRTWVEKPDGSRIELPSFAISLPATTAEGPRLPPGCGGGSIIVEVTDTRTGEQLGKTSSPIGF